MSKVIATTKHTVFNRAFYISAIVFLDDATLTVAASPAPRFYNVGSLLVTRSCLVFNDEPHTNDT